MVSPPTLGLSLCAGGGGLDMGIGLAEPGFATAAFCEIDRDAAASLIAGQRAGYLHAAPIWDDLKRFSGYAWRGVVDAVLAGYPCQPFSAAGQRRGADDPRHLWPHVARIVRECEPEWVFLENVAGHVSLGLEAVLRDLWDMGFTPAAGLFSAAEVGAPHERLRIFILAHTDEPASRHRPLQPGREQRLHPQGRGAGAGHHQLVDTQGDGRREGRTGPELRVGRNAAPARAGGAMANPNGTELEGIQRGQRDSGRWQIPHGYPELPGRTGLHPPGPADTAAWAYTLAVAPHLAPAAGLADCLAWAGRVAQALGGADEAAAQSALCRMADGLATRARALRLLGNGVHPLAAGHAWRTLSHAHGLGRVDLEAACGGGGGDAG
jgi:DNA (cytosine-5)-methyltransferase 1